MNTSLSTIASALLLFNLMIPAATNAQNGSHPFSEAAIAQVGVSGIEQSKHPDCWLDASLAALAQTPRGQHLISNMIVQQSPSSWVVTFPGQSQSCQVTNADIEQFGLRDVAPWAAIVESAGLKAYPQNEGAYGTTTHQPAIQTGIELLTGVPANVVRPDSCSIDQLASIFDQAVQSKTPIVMATKSPRENRQPVQVISPNHAYTVVDFDRRSQTITLRNPQGREKVQLETPLVKQLGQGLLQMNLDTVALYFRFVAWPSK